MLLLILLVVLSFGLCPGGPLADLPPARVAPALPPLPEVRWPQYRLPEKLFLCGEPVPLEDRAVREALDREFTVRVWSRVQTIMWLKQAHRYFPAILEKIRSHHLHQDLKYVVLVESDLRQNARSAAGALGPWQFMAPTAQRFRLKTGDAIDERLDLGQATDAALQYLKTLYQQFKSWPLALAAYNIGEGRIQKELAAQGVNNYYHLALPEETERYVHRILAAKIILEAPASYGYDLSPEDLYSPLEFDQADLTLTQEIPVRNLAAACGTYYKAFKTLNPWIRGANLPAGSYRLKLPPGTARRFQEAMRR